MNFQEQFQDMAEKATAGKVSDDAAKVLMLAQEHFNQKRDQLGTILAHKEAGIRFGDDDDDDAIEIEAGTDMHKGFMVGIRLALYFIGEFPVTLTDRDAEGEG